MLNINMLRLLYILRRAPLCNYMLHRIRLRRRDVTGVGSDWKQRLTMCAHFVQPWGQVISGVISGEP
jgi:hypothetical protein